VTSAITSARLVVGASVAGYRRRAVRRSGVLAALAAALALSLLVDASVGPGNLTLSEILQAFVDPAGVSPRHAVIVWDIRLPVAIMAALIGAMLGAAGAQMQTILANPLAADEMPSVNGSASVGASVAIIFGFSLIPLAGPIIVTVNAFLFALGAAAMVLALTRVRGVSADTMILFGIALMFSFNAILGLMQYRASETQLSQIVFWMMGSLGRSSWEKIAIAVAVSGIVLPLAWRRRWALTAIRTGDERAASLGVDVDRLRLEVMIHVSVLAATAVSFVGVVGFIGLVGPHIARMLVGEDQRWFLPASALAGALLLSVTSVVAKSIVPGVIYPIGIITALIGVPFFVSLILSRGGVAR
jgi:iron complex transport system permease protein